MSKLGDKEAAGVVILVPEATAAEQSIGDSPFVFVLSNPSYQSAHWRSMVVRKEGQLFCIVFIAEGTVLVEQRPPVQAVVQFEPRDLHRFDLKKRMAAEQFSDHGFVLNGVNAAGGIDQLSTGDQQRCAPACDGHLHREHLASFFGCPLPPNVSVLSGCGRS